MRTEPAKKEHRLIVADYKRTICDTSAEIDPNNELDWFALSLGFLMGRGLSFDEAHTLALWVGYTTGDFQKKEWKDWTP